MAQIVSKKDMGDKREQTLTFYLPTPDLEVQKMLIHRGHRVSFKEDNDWDVALFVGGADICPALYGEQLHTTTSFNLTRDLREVAKLKLMHHLRLKVGICRGAQLLNLMSGGRMWQHVNGHHTANGHECRFFDSDTDIVKVSSRHHQMMIPASNAWNIAYAAEATTFINFTDGEKNFVGKDREQAGWTDSEVCWYEHSNSLCFQPHPEDADDKCRNEFFDLIQFFYDDKKQQQALKDWD